MQFTYSDADKSLRMASKSALCLAIVGGAATTGARLQLAPTGCAAFVYSAAQPTGPVCNCVSGACTYDSTCSATLLGCGAEGMTHCRFCGFGRYASVQCAATSPPTSGAPTPPPATGWTADLSRWTDYFDVPAEQGLNQGHQFYNANPSETSFYDKAKGGLVLRAMRSTASAGFAYAAPWLQSKKNLTFGLGTLTVSATFPKGIGLWPAIWMLPQSEHEGALPCRYLDSQGHCSWPTMGEMDIFETVNDAETGSYIWQTLHMGNVGSGPNTAISQLPQSPANRWPQAKSGSNGGLPAAWWATPHTLQYTRHDGFLQWSIDGEITQTVTQDQVLTFLNNAHNRPSSYGSAAIAPFDDSNPFNLIFNVAVGGLWPCETVNCGTDRSAAIPNCPVNNAPMDMIIHALSFQPYS